MKHYGVIGLAFASVMVLGCGEKEAPPQQSQVAPEHPPMHEAAVAPAAPSTPGSGSAPAAAPAPMAEPAGDARAVRQPEGTPPPLPSSVVTPPATTTTTPPATTTTTKGASAKGSLLKESELKERPFIDAVTVAKLAAQTKVTISERSSGWYRVESGGKQGWVRMLNVKVSEGAESLGASSELQQAASLATGRAGSGNVVSTSGLRGLDEEQLTAAKPDYAQLEKLDSYGASKEAANSYAQQNGLKGRSVSYLPAPK